jgi:ABC-2 type transport system permease protein
MSKIGLIVRKEYMRRVHKKSFLIFTFLTPFLLILLVAIPLWLSTIKDDNAKTIAVSDSTGKYGNIFKNTESYRFVQTGITLEKFKNQEDGELYAYLIIEDDLLKKPSAIAIYADKQVTPELKDYISGQLEEHLRNEKLASYRIPRLKEIIDESKIDLDIKTVKWDKSGEEKTGSAELATVIGIFSTFLIYMFIFMYGAMVMRGVMEEKTSRIVEVLVSSVKPIELMMGKIIGIALVGLTQFLLWVVFSVGLFTVVGLIFGLNHLPETSAMQGMQQIPDSKAMEIMQVVNSFNFQEIIGYFILYFIGGYLLYASLFAAIGSAVDNETDTQQFMLPVTIPIVFAMYAGIYSAQNPDGPLAFWCSIIPFTSPIVMMVRLPFDVPLWQKILSLSLLTITFLGTTWMAAKIYRTGILMYGKKVNFKELWKWLKY